MDYPLLGIAGQRYTAFFTKTGKQKIAPVTRRDFRI